MTELMEALITLMLLTAFSQVSSDTLNQKYEKGDPVPVYVNKVGPFNNPSETYPYYSLPFCPPENLKDKKESLGELLNGDHLVSSPFKFDFLVDRTSAVLCRKNLTKEEVSRFQTAVALDYYLQMYYDDLPIWGFIGKVDRKMKSNRDENKYFIFTHFHFQIHFNGNYVIEVQLLTEHSSVAELTSENVVVEFLYDVTWQKTNIPFEKRMEKYSKSAFLPRHFSIHRSAITNSFSIMFLLIGCLAGLYVCVLRRDFNNIYIWLPFLIRNEGDAELADNQEETGWKILHGDVFRYPEYKSLFAAAVGSGAQLFTVAVFTIALGLFGIFRPYNRGIMKTALVISYAITCGLAGFTSVSFYHQLEGKEWVRNLLLTGCLFSCPLFLTFCLLNTIATFYGTTAALPLATILIVLLLWIFLAMLSLSFGGILGKMMNSKFEAPCRTTKCPRDIPTLPWYKGVLPQMTLAGLLPYSVLYIELYYILVSVWGHRVYTLYGVICVVFILLLIVTALVSVGLTYLQLAAENHQWWWRSFLCGGSTSLYVYAYGFYYYFLLSDMNGLMQTSFFFGYMACICFGLFLMLGTIGFAASLLFVRHIYSNIKGD